MPMYWLVIITSLLYFLSAAELAYKARYRVVVQFELAARGGRVDFGSAFSKSAMISSTVHM
jgi:hypothetical protein